MAEKRSGYKYVTKLPGDENFVSMIQFKGQVFICTNKSMYKMVGDIVEAIKIQIAEVPRPTTYKVDGVKLTVERDHY